MEKITYDEKPKNDKAGAEIVLNDDDTSKSGTTTTAAATTSVYADIDSTNTTTVTGVSGDMSQTSVTTTTAPVLIGPYSKEALADMTTTVSVDAAILHEIYPEQLSILGDSIASGFGAYEVLTNPYDFATGNLASWSINDYTFEYEGTSGTYKDVLAASQPGYIYISMGMNDVNMVTSDQYVENYRQIITDVQTACPESNIIVASITPIASSSSFAANSTIVKFNEKLQALVEEFGSANIRYFDAHSILIDSASGALASENDGGDGIHLSYSAYYSIIENLYTIFDEMPVPAAILDEVNEVSSSVTETVTEESTGESTDESDADSNS